MTYFEHNEDLSEAERLGGAGKIMEKSLFPPEGVNVISWLSSPDLWGVVVLEADTGDPGDWSMAGGRSRILQTHQNLTRDRGTRHHPSRGRDQPIRERLV